MKTGQIALIPAYEPTQLLCNLLEQAKQAGFELIVAESKRLSTCKNTKNPEVLLHTSGFLHTGIRCQNSSCRPMTIIQIYAQVFGIISMPIFGIFLLSSVTGR